MLLRAESAEAGPFYDKTSESYPFRVHPLEDCGLPRRQAVAIAKAPALALRIWRLWSNQISTFFLDSSVELSI